MSWVYGEPVNVQARADGRPVSFVWRGRLYTVQAILEHWVINREWWQDPQADPCVPELEFWRVEALLARKDDPSSRGGCTRSPGGASPPQTPLTDPPDRPPLDHPAPGRAMPPAVYELRNEAATGAWILR
jgi:Family of unknown function (DUF6504)